jgi:polysaccharide export outer membrane protein
MYFLFGALLFSAIVFAGGCSAHNRSESRRVENNVANPVGQRPQTSAPSAPDDLERLAVLWKSRGGDGSVSDYRVGPGDVLEIAVPGMEELKGTTVRVSNEGTISLSFVGSMQVGGLSEMEIRENVARRLEKDYMHNPQVHVHVREHHARQVAITGAVSKPGLYSLTRGAETLLDAISLAGGMTKEASPRVLFIAAGAQKQNGAGASPDVPAASPSANAPVERAYPIVIDFDRLAREGNQAYLALPIRSGDVIIIPGSGEVLVEGWVEKPGSYKITPGLTLLGALAAAGGATFAADGSTVTIMRATKNGEKLLLTADVQKIKRGEEPDLPVQEGDVIDVPSSGPKLIAYGIYRFFSTALHVGANVPVPVK